MDDSWTALPRRRVGLLSSGSDARDEWQQTSEGRRLSGLEVGLYTSEGTSGSDSIGEGGGREGGKERGKGEGGKMERSRVYSCYNAQ